MIGLAKAYAATAPSAGFSAFSFPTSLSVSGPPGSLTTPQTTVNVNGGVEPYVYSWIKLSGANVTVSDSASNTVSFSASGSNGLELNAVYQCTITDDALSVLTVEASSNFQFGTPL
jgi:hypothetical protein